MNSTMRSLVFWMAMAVIAVMVWNFSTKFQTAAKSLTFTEFMMAVDTGQIAAVTITVSGSAAAWTRAATFGVSPNTSPPSAITTGPVCIPIRTERRMPLPNASSALSGSIASMIASPARIARSGSSSRAVGQPK